MRHPAQARGFSLFEFAIIVVVTAFTLTGFSLLYAERIRAGIVADEASTLSAYSAALESYAKANSAALIAVDSGLLQDSLGASLAVVDQPANPRHPSVATLKKMRFLASEIPDVAHITGTPSLAIEVFPDGCDTPTQPYCNWNTKVTTGRPILRVGQKPYDAVLSPGYSLADYLTAVKADPLGTVDHVAINALLKRIGGRAAASVFTDPKQYDNSTVFPFSGLNGDWQDGIVKSTNPNPTPGLIRLVAQGSTTGQNVVMRNDGTTAMQGNLVVQNNQFSGDVGQGGAHINRVGFGGDNPISNDVVIKQYRANSVTFSGITEFSGKQDVTINGNVAGYDKATMGGNTMVDQASSSTFTANNNVITANSDLVNGSYQGTFSGDGGGYTSSRSAGGANKGLDQLNCANQRSGGSSAVQPCHFN